MKIVLTGGHGQLGTELRALIPGIVAPPSSELNITDLRSVLAVVEREHPDVIVYAAADWVGAKLLHIVIENKCELVYRYIQQIWERSNVGVVTQLPHNMGLGFGCYAEISPYFH